jgi:transposase InsO family protein
MSFELIEAEEAHYPKALMCRALGLSRSGHHAYSTRGPSRRALEEQQLDVLVAAIFAELGGRYGAPRIEQELRRRGHCTSRKRVAASLRRQGLAARPKRRWKRTTDSNHAEPIAPNRLQRDFTASAPVARQNLVASRLRRPIVSVVETTEPLTGDDLSAEAARSGR